MVGMCRIVGHRSQFIMLLLLLAQNLMNIILAHFQDRYVTFLFLMLILNSRSADTFSYVQFIYI